MFQIDQADRVPGIGEDDRQTPTHTASARGGNDFRHRAAIRAHLGFRRFTEEDGAKLDEGFF